MTCPRKRAESDIASYHRSPLDRRYRCALSLAFPDALFVDSTANDIPGTLFVRYSSEIDKINIIDEVRVAHRVYVLPAIPRTPG